MGMEGVGGGYAGELIGMERYVGLCRAMEDYEELWRAKEGHRRQWRALKRYGGDFMSSSKRSQNYVRVVSGNI